MKLNKIFKERLKCYIELMDNIFELFMKFVIVPGSIILFSFLPFIILKESNVPTYPIFNFVTFIICFLLMLYFLGKHVLLISEYKK